MLALYRTALQYDDTATTAPYTPAGPPATAVGEVCPPFHAGHTNIPRIVPWLSRKTCEQSTNPRSKGTHRRRKQSGDGPRITSAKNPGISLTFRRWLPSGRNCMHWMLRTYCIYWFVDYIVFVEYRICRFVGWLVVWFLYDWWQSLWMERYGRNESNQRIGKQIIMFFTWGQQSNGLKNERSKKPPKPNNW